MNLLEIQEGLRSQGVEEGAGLDHQTREVALERGRENARRKAREIKVCHRAVSKGRLHEDEAVSDLVSPSSQGSTQRRSGKTTISPLLSPAPPLQVQSKQLCTAPRMMFQTWPMSPNQVRVKVKAIGSLETSLSMGWKGR